jgi:catechol 2,3-dioxygenase
MSEKLISQLAHVELISPVPAESVKWFKDVLGLEETETKGQSTYLRTWSEHFHHNLVVTEGPEARLGHIGWRTAGEGDAEIIEGKLKQRGIEGEWKDDSVGHGKAYRFNTPGGHPTEVFWDVERFKPSKDMVADRYPDRPQKFIRRGVYPRYLDHITINVPDHLGEIKFYEEVFGSLATASIVPDQKIGPVFTTLTHNRGPHDLALVPEFSPARGRVNHVAFWLDQRRDIEQAADVLINMDTPIEFGPGIHGIDEITYLYVREPSGVRIELNSGGNRTYQPDWQRTEWGPKDGATNFYRTHDMPQSMMESFPSGDQGQPVPDEERETMAETTNMFVDAK